MAFVWLQLGIVAACLAVALIVVIPAAALAGVGGDQPGHYRHLDGVRGLAAMAVVACHINQHVLDLAGDTRSPELGNHMGTLGVHMFFALTAFLFVRKALDGNLDPFPFYRSRIARIVPLYAFAAFIAVCAGLWLTRHSAAPLLQTTSDVVGVFAFGFTGAPALTIKGFNALSLIGIAWTLPYEWGFYLLLPIAVAIARVSGAARIMLGAGVALWLFRQFYVVGETPSAFFLAGVVAAALSERWPLDGHRRVLTVASLALAVIALDFTPGFYSLAQVAVTLPLFLCLLFSDAPILKLRPLRLLGQISFSVYLLQYLVLFSALSVGSRFHTAIHARLFIAPGAAGVVAALIVLSAFTYRYIELPGMRWRARLRHSR